MDGSRRDVRGGKKTNPTRSETKTNQHKIALSIKRGTADSITQCGGGGVFSWLVHKQPAAKLCLSLISFSLFLSFLFQTKGTLATTRRFFFFDVEQIIAAPFGFRFWFRFLYWFFFFKLLFAYVL